MWHTQTQRNLFLTRVSRGAIQRLASYKKGLKPAEYLTSVVLQKHKEEGEQPASAIMSSVLSCGNSSTSLRNDIPH